MDGIDHLDLVVTSLERSLDLYAGLLLHDPDGLELEIVHRPREADLVRRIEELEARLRDAPGG